MVVFLVVVSLVSMVGWTEWNYQTESLKSRLVYLIVSMTSLAIATYLSLKSQ